MNEEGVLGKLEPQKDILKAREIGVRNAMSL